MTGLLVPKHHAVRWREKQAATVPPASATVPTTAEQIGGSESTGLVPPTPPVAATDDNAPIRLYSIDTPIPPEMPEVALYRMWIMPVGIREQSRGGIFFSDDTVEAQMWNNPLGRVCAMGPVCYRGSRYRDCDMTPEMGPKIGDLIIFNPRSPKRRTWYGVTFVIINDDEYEAIIPHRMHNQLKLFME